MIKRPAYVLGLQWTSYTLDIKTFGNNFLFYNTTIMSILKYQTLNLSSRNLKHPF